MKKTVCIFTLFAFFLSGCSTNLTRTEDSSPAVSSAAATSETCTSTFDFDDPYALEGATIYENELGQHIRLTRVDDVSETDATLYFAADFAWIVGATTLLSGCVPAADEDGNVGFLCAALSVEPAAVFSAIYAMRTTALTSTGNEFAIHIYVADEDAFTSSAIREVSVTLSELPQLMLPAE